MTFVYGVKEIIAGGLLAIGLLLMLYAVIDFYVIKPIVKKFKGGIDKADS